MAASGGGIGGRKVLRDAEVNGSEVGWVEAEEDAAGLGGGGGVAGALVGVEERAPRGGGEWIDGEPGVGPASGGGPVVFGFGEIEEAGDGSKGVGLARGDGGQGVAFGRGVVEGGGGAGEEGVEVVGAGEVEVGVGERLEFFADGFPIFRVGGFAGGAEEIVDVGNGAETGDILSDEIREASGVAAEIEAAAEGKGGFASEGGEVAIERIERGEMTGEGGVDLETVGEAAEENAEFFEAEAFDEEFDDEVGLEVGELGVAAVFGFEEGGAHAADGLGFSVEDAVAVVERHELAPGGVVLALLENGDALAEPPRHAVARHREGDDVRELVPENGLPVGVRGGRAVDGEDRAEADAEEAADIGHAEGADGEVLWVVVNFNNRGSVELEAVAFSEMGVGAFEQREGAVAVDRRFRSGHSDTEMRTGEDGEFFELIVERGEIVGLDVVGVGFMRGGGKLPALVFLAKAEEVLRELDAGGREGRIEGKGETLGGGPVGELVLLGEFEADEVIDAGIVGPGGEGG